MFVLHSGLFHLKRHTFYCAYKQLNLIVQLFVLSWLFTVWKQEKVYGEHNLLYRIHYFDRKNVKKCDACKYASSSWTTHCKNWTEVAYEVKSAILCSLAMQPTMLFLHFHSIFYNKFTHLSCQAKALEEAWIFWKEPKVL